MLLSVFFADYTGSAFCYRSSMVFFFMFDCWLHHYLIFGLPFER